MLRAEPSFTTKPIDEALSVLKSIAVVPVAKGPSLGTKYYATGP